MVETSLPGSIGERGLQVGHELSQRGIHNVTRGNDRSSSSATGCANQDRAGLRNERLGQSDSCLRGFLRCALAGPADWPGGIVGGQDLPQHRIVLNKYLSFGEWCQNFRKLQRTRRAVRSQI